MLPQAADSTSPAAQALADLDKLIEMLDIWEVGTSTKGVSVSVDPFMLIPSREFQSVFFRVSVWQDKVGETDVTGDCICTGGCYSSFLAETWPLQVYDEQIPPPLVRCCSSVPRQLTDTF